MGRWWKGESTAHRGVGSVGDFGVSAVKEEGSEQAERTGRWTKKEIREI
jgi:hypothetical protein